MVFEYLAALNRNVDTAIDTLRKLAEYPELQKRESFRVSQSYFREHLADANVSILEALHGAEERAGGAAYKERRAYEKLVRDPDDCYLEVIQREKERQQQGLPSLVGIHYGAHYATNEEVIEIHTEVEGETSEPEPAPSEDADEAETDEEGEERRQRIVARVEALRTARTMTNQELHSLIGSSAAESWRGYFRHKGDEGWRHATPQMFEKIAQVFGINSVELLR
jgi:hypothetical protein